MHRRRSIALIWLAAAAAIVCLRVDAGLSAWVAHVPIELLPIALVRPRLLPRRDDIRRLVVGWDIRPGQYRLTAVDGAAYFARRDLGGEIVENGFSASALSVTVQPSDWLLQVSGELTAA